MMAKYLYVSGFSPQKSDAEKGREDSQKQPPEVFHKNVVLKNFAI